MKFSYVLLSSALAIGGLAACRGNSEPAKSPEPSTTTDEG